MRVVSADALVMKEIASNVYLVDEEVIRNAPTFDAEPVVRCKNCVKRGLNLCPMHIVGTPADEDFLKKVDDDFCSYGERSNK